MRFIVTRGKGFCGLCFIGMGEDYSEMWYALTVFWCSKLSLTAQVLTVPCKMVCCANVICKRDHQTGFPKQGF